MVARVKESTMHVDTDVRIPNAILKQAERAEEWLKATTKPAEGAEETPPPDPAAPPVTADSSPPAEPAPPPPAPTPPPPAPPSDDDQSWERRYNAMKGRFDQASNTIRDLNARLNEMQSVVASMHATPPARTTPDTDPNSLITPKEIEEYGQDFIDVVGKKARAEFAPLAKQYEDKIAQLESRLAGVAGHVGQNAKQQMYASLDEHVPTWRELNKSQDFVSWLQLPDAFSGAIRHELLKDAFNRNDTRRVAAFFNGFLSEEAVTRPATPSSAPAPTPAPAPKMDLTGLAAPGRAKTAAGTSAPAEKPIFTRSQVAEFYAAVTAGKFRGREADEKRIENQIFDAQREGRIR